MMASPGQKLKTEITGSEFHVRVVELISGGPVKIHPSDEPDFCFIQLDSTRKSYLRHQRKLRYVIATKKEQKLFSWFVFFFKRH